jgi:hypothetical protein
MGKEHAENCTFRAAGYRQMGLEQCWAASLVIMRTLKTKKGSLRWQIPFPFKPS